MTSTDIAIRDPQGGTLAIADDQIAWSPAQAAALAHIGIDKAPQADQQVFMHVCQRTGLDPFNREIYMIGRKERGKNGEPDTIKWTIQTGIDGFRKRAEEHPQYAGTLDPEWCGTDGNWRDSWVERLPPVAARVKVLRHDREHPIALPVRFIEFAATFSDGNLQGQWKTKPAHMIAKVAEAAALRKAFPRDFAGIYTDDEMEHVGNRGRAAAQPPATAGISAAELTGRPVVVDAEPEPDTAPAATPTSLATEGAGAEPDAAAPDAGAELADQKLHRAMHKLWREADVTDREERLLVTQLLLGRVVDTSKTLTTADAEEVISGLNRLVRERRKPLADAVNDLLQEYALKAGEEATEPDPRDEAGGGQEAEPAAGESS